MGRVPRALGPGAREGRWRETALQASPPLPGPLFPPCPWPGFLAQGGAAGQGSCNPGPPAPGQQASPAQPLAAPGSAQDPLCFLQAELIGVHCSPGLPGLCAPPSGELQILHRSRGQVLHQPLGLQRLSLSCHCVCDCLCVSTSLSASDVSVSAWCGCPMCLSVCPGLGLSLRVCSGPLGPSPGSLDCPSG